MTAARGSWIKSRARHARDARRSQGRSRGAGGADPAVRKVGVDAGSAAVGGEDPFKGLQEGGGLRLGSGGDPEMAGDADVADQNAGVE